MTTKHKNNRSQIDLKRYGSSLGMYIENQIFYLKLLTNNKLYLVYTVSLLYSEALFLDVKKCRSSGFFKVTIYSD